MGLLEAHTIAQQRAVNLLSERRHSQLRFASICQLASPPGPLLILVLEGLVHEVLAPRTSIEPI